MHKIVVDTCVWLDLIKDPNHETLLNILDELIKHNELVLIVPKTVIEEFSRNKARVIKESSQSISSVIKRAKEVVDKLGDNKKKKTVIDLLNDVDYKIPTLGATLLTSVSRIEKLLNKSVVIETTDAIKLRAAERAIEKKAPFHRTKNNFNDAIIIETYAALLESKDISNVRFAFITHNKNDFSLPTDERKPHPDFQNYFSKVKSRYYIKLSEAVHRIRPDLVSELIIENEWVEEPRSFNEILLAEGELLDKVWYNRHQNWLYHIEKGEHKIVSKSNGAYNPKETPMEIYNGARKAAAKVEKKYGMENLGPWDDFEWGMINGKLSALRWVLGSEWDFLDT
ncbi:MAG TPA: PIN domain-containing protein [Chitinophagales bacterium]|nr:PIN domain-containing protein [Chitinophagales bacterium]